MNRFRRRLTAAFGIAAVLFLLLLFLAAAEHDADGSSIHTVWDALWYFLITLSTVGYGDMYPVTFAGKLIASIFVLMSVGALAFAVGSVLSLMRGELLPKLRLSRLRDCRLYILTAWNPETAALAKHIAEEDPDAWFLFSGECGLTEVPESIGETNRGILFPGVSLETNLRRAAVKQNRCAVLVTGADLSENDRIAAEIMEAENSFEEASGSAETAGGTKEAKETGIPLYVRTVCDPELLTERMTPFNEYDCTARMYWKQFPLRREEDRVVLIGCGEYGARLLLRALEVNVFGPLKRTEYHIFGDASEFLRDHPELSSAVALGAAEEDRDSVIFHEDAWNSCPELFLTAARIVICEDREEENLRICQEMRTWFPVSAVIHIRSSRKADGAERFGAAEEIFTTELVMRKQLSRLGHAMHEIYRTSAGGNAPEWNELGAFLRQSNMAAADHLAVKVRILLGHDAFPCGEVTPELCGRAYRRWQETRQEGAELYRLIEHERWERFHYLRNWKYAPVRDNRIRRHHLLVPYQDLSPAEQAKDDYAWELLGQLSGSGNGGTTDEKI